MTDASSELLAQLCSCVCQGQGWVTSSERQTPQPPVFEQIQLLWLGLLVCSCCGSIVLSMERLCQESCLCEVLSWNLLKLTYLCLFLYHLKSKEFSAFHALGAASFCVEIIHDNPTALCRNRGLLPALLTLHMFYLSRYLFICHSWFGCFAICSFSTMIHIYSDFRGLIWRNSTVGGQTFFRDEAFVLFSSQWFFNFSQQNIL